MEGGNTERMLHKCADRIRQESRSLELETILSVFASYVLDTELIRRVLRWEMQLIKESPILQEAFTERFEQGEHNEALKWLRRVLISRFQINEPYFEQKEFETLDLETVEKLGEAAWTAKSLADFEEMLVEVGK